MEGKNVILSVFILNLVIAQTQVDAKSCCPSKIARNIFSTCRFSGAPRLTCVKLSGCKDIDGKKCHSRYLKDDLENSGDAVNEFCKLGCTFSMCGAITNLQNFDASEMVNGAVEQCSNACSIFCNKDSKPSLGTTQTNIFTKIPSYLRSLRVLF